VKKLVLAALLVVVVAALAGGSYAVARGGGNGGGFSARLDGWQEVPSQVTSGDGSFQARVIRVEGDLAIEYVLRYEDLEGPAGAAHIHIGSKHENGAVSAFLCGGGGEDPCPPTEGEVDGVILRSEVSPGGSSTAQGVGPGEIEDLIRAMRRGETYANVHTFGGPPPRAPGGEIRGQIRRGGGHGMGDHDDD
jgi:CHRD domain-containing protein